MIWGRMSGEAVFFSKWNGTGFNAPVKLNPTWFKIATASWMGPDIASNGDTVYVVVKRTPESSDTNHIYLLKSFYGGASFMQPTRVDFIADSFSRFPTVAVNSSGNPVVAFMKFNSSFLDSRWVVSTSSDFGNTFTADVKASDWNGPGDGVCDCCPGAIVQQGTISAMLCRDNQSNIRDIWAGISNNSGVSFTNGFSVDKNNRMIMSCLSSGPDSIIIGDTLYSVFMSAGAGSYRNYLSRSSVSTLSVGSVNNLTGNVAGLSQQNYPRIDHFGSAVAIAWKQTVSGTAQLSLLLTNNIANGFPSNYEIVDLNDVTNTDVALSNGAVHIVWQDDNSGTVKYMKGTFAPIVSTITALPEIRTEIFQDFS